MEDVGFKRIDMIYTNLMNNGRKFDFRNTSFIELKNLLDSLISSGKYSLIIDNLDIILKYTSLSNMDWLNCDMLYREPYFLNKFLNSFKCFPFDNKKGIVLYIVFSKMKVDYQYICDYYLDKILCGDCTSDFYKDFFNKLSSRNKVKFLQCVLNNKVIVNYCGYDLDVLSYNYIAQHIIEFIGLTNDILSLINIFKYDNKVCSVINSFYKGRYSDISNIIVSEDVLSKYNKGIKELIYLIVLDVLKNENANILDVYWVGGGGFCSVLKIKNKVVKFGFNRETPRFANNPYIIKPLLRKSFNIDGMDFFVEVTEMASLEEEVTLNEMFILYAKLRMLGLVWTDIHEGNVGRLTKNNIIYWNGNLDPSDKELNLDEYRGKKIVLKKGDVVLIDADRLYDENDERRFKTSGLLAQAFERRYLKEKEEMIKKKVI